MKMTAKLLFPLALAVLLLTACGIVGEGTRLEFSFTSPEPTTFVSEPKVLYFEEDLDTLPLDATLEMDGGTVLIKGVDPETGEELWSLACYESESFVLEPHDLKAGTELLLIVEAENCSKMKLVLTSSYSLAERPEAPEKYKVEKPAKP